MNDGQTVGYDTNGRKVNKNDVIFVLPLVDKILEYLSVYKLGGVWRNTTAGDKVE